MKGFDFHIEIEENSTPVFYKARPLSSVMKSRVEDALHRLESLGITGKMDHSDWTASAVPIMKVSGDILPCSTCKLTFNKVAKEYRYPSPLTDEILASLAYGTKFTKLGLSNAYHQVPVETSKNVTTINT